MATTPRIMVHQGLSVAGIEVEGHEVSVLLTGGAAGWSGTVSYDFPDPDEFERWMGRLREWRDDGHPVTVVERGGAVSIVDEQALFTAALGTFE